MQFNLPRKVVDFCPGQGEFNFTYDQYKKILKAHFSDPNGRRLNLSGQVTSKLLKFYKRGYVLKGVLTSLDTNHPILEITMEKKIALHKRN